MEGCFQKGVLGFPERAELAPLLGKRQPSGVLSEENSMSANQLLVHSVALKSTTSKERRNHPFHLPSHLSSGLNYTEKLSGLKYIAADILQ